MQTPGLWMKERGVCVYVIVGGRAIDSRESNHIVILCSSSS